MLVIPEVDLPHILASYGDADHVAERIIRDVDEPSGDSRLVWVPEVLQAFHQIVVRPPGVNAKEVAADLRRTLLSLARECVGLRCAAIVGQQEGSVSGWKREAPLSLNSGNSSIVQGRTCSSDHWFHRFSDESVFG